MTTTDEAIGQFAKAIELSPDATDGDLINTLASNGVVESVAERVVRFTPVAFGRQLLDGLGITFSDEYWRFDAMGKVVQSGNLSEDDVFTAATTTAPTFTQSPSFQTIALSSSEVSAVNQALNGGSNPADLVAGPVVIFDEQPTPMGITRAQDRIQASLQSEASPNAPDKPWWKVW